jgi:hypothetical protein
MYFDPAHKKKDAILSLVEHEFGSSRDFRSRGIVAAQVSENWIGGALINQPVVGCQIRTEQDWFVVFTRCLCG